MVPNLISSIHVQHPILFGWLQISQGPLCVFLQVKLHFYFDNKNFNLILKIAYNIFLSKNNTSRIRSGM